MIRKSIFHACVTLLLFGCGPNRSDIIVEKTDPTLIAGILAAADTILLLEHDTQWPAEAVKGKKCVFEKTGREIDLWMNGSDQVLLMTERQLGVLTDSVAFHPNGQRVFALPFDDNGKIDGHARYFHENGRVQADGRFHTGFRSGVWRFFDSAGLLQRTEEYNQYGVKLRG